MENSLSKNTLKVLENFNAKNYPVLLTSLDDTDKSIMLNKFNDVFYPSIRNSSLTESVKDRILAYHEGQFFYLLNEVKTPEGVAHSIALWDVSLEDRFKSESLFFDILIKALIQFGKIQNLIELHYLSLINICEIILSHIEETTHPIVQSPTKRMQTKSFVRVQQGEFYRSIEEFDKAEECFKKALQVINSDNFGQHLTDEDILKNILSLYEIEKDFKKIHGLISEWSQGNFKNVGIERDYELSTEMKDAAAMIESFFHFMEEGKSNDNFVTDISQKLSNYFKSKVL